VPAAAYGLLLGQPNNKREPPRTEVPEGLPWASTQLLL
jgi:hypothetical protein